VTLPGDDDGFRSEINVTPLVDVMLVLLVIFMAVTPLLRSELPLDLPRAATGREPERDARRATITVAADGALRLDGAPIAAPELPAALVAALGTSGDRAILLEADRAAAYGAVVAVVDAARAAGVERIGVATNAPTPAGAS
jgi:biopolymer transport protein ExbD/biopolymer transport protein TolR